MTRILRLVSLTFACAAISLFTHSPARSDEVVLRSGLRLNGRVQQSRQLSSDPGLQGDGRQGSYKLIDMKYKYYFVPNRLVTDHNPGDSFRSESFKLKHKRTGRPRTMPDWIGAFSSDTPFDEFGLREVTLETSNRTLKIIQGIEELKPDHVWIKSLTHRWEYGMATTSLRPEVLDKVLRRAIDPTNPNDRLAACRFLIEARQFMLADIWITAIEEEFPAFAKQCRVSKLNLRQAYAKQLLTELIQRRGAGQHALVQASLKQFPRTELPAEVIESVEYLQKEYAARQTAIDTINDHLQKLEAAIDPKLVPRVRPMRSELQSNLGFSSLDRLQAYINLSKDKTLKPQERLAIAYSGWMLGSADAITNLQETMGLWEAREHITAYLGSTDPLVRRRAVDELQRLEGASPRAIARLLRTSPPREPVNLAPGDIGSFSVATSAGEADYKVVLPPEYTPFHDYPMIVALRQSNQTQEDTLTWWAGTRQQPLQAQRRGYIVIAPEYMPAGTPTWESNADSHEVVLSSVRDALRRFSVDPDRVFLTGHGSGADATFDIAMSHPDVFAGAIPIVGLVGPECNQLYENGAQIPWYVISGQRHRDALAHNSSVLDRIGKRNEELIVCEYRDRGFESYYAEIHNLFDWMDFHTREEMPGTFSAVTVRPESGSLYWVEGAEFPDFLTNQNFARDGKRRRLRNIEFNLRVTSTNTIQISRSGAKHLTLRLMDGVVDFNKPIRVEGRKRARINPEPSVESVLEDFRIYRDRKRIALQRASL